MARTRITAEAPEPDDLTPSERVFVQEYLIDRNGTRAYRVAYPGAGYATAKKQAAVLRTKGNVKAEIDSAVAAQEARTRITADRVLREVARLAFTNLSDLMDTSDPENPRMRPRKDVPASAWAAVQSISRTKDGVRVKLFSKDAALDRLMRHLGLYKDLPTLELLLGALPEGMAAEVRRAMLGGPRATSPDPNPETN